MHLLSTLPTAIALPTLALIVHFQGYFNIHGNQVNWSSTKSNISVIRNVSSEVCYCMPTSSPNEQQLAIIGKLLEINISKENMPKIIKMLDSLQWIDVKPNNSNKVFLYDLNKVFLNQKMNNILRERSNLIGFILIKLCFWIVYRFILKNTFFGVLLNIATTRLGRFIRRPFTSCKMSQKSHSLDNDEKESLDDGEEIFQDCSSHTKELNIIDSEELLAKAHQPDEKDHDTDVEHDTGYGSFVKPISCNHENSTLSSTLRSSDYVNAAPEKFKQFLHQKNETLEQLGISFTEENYIEDRDSFLGGEGEEHLSLD